MFFFNLTVVFSMFKITQNTLTEPLQVHDNYHNFVRCFMYNILSLPQFSIVLLANDKSVNFSMIINDNNCVVPENIHTPTTEGIGNSEGEGGGGCQRPRKFQRGGGLYDWVSFQTDSRGPLIQYGFESWSSCSKILSYLLSRTSRWKTVAWILVFDSYYIWNTFSFFKKHFGS